MVCGGRCAGRPPTRSVFTSCCSSLQLERSYQRFTAFYASRHSGRKLTWLYQLSKGELVTNCFKNRYTLQVRSPFYSGVFFKSQ